MECSAKGKGTPCTGPATRRCGLCGVAAYCSPSHQILHWNDHREQCARFEQQMQRAHLLHDFPFSFTEETTLQVSAKRVTGCSFLTARGLHQTGLWKYECSCGTSVASFDYSWMYYDWNLPNGLCPCTDPINPLTKCLNSWKEYYLWRCLPFHSPVALLLHWKAFQEAQRDVATIANSSLIQKLKDFCSSGTKPLTIYQGMQLANNRRRSVSEIGSKLHIHYLGPDRELRQLAILGELHALFPGLEMHMELVGPAVPQLRDGERIRICSYARCTEITCTCKLPSENVISNAGNSIITLHLRNGFYHDRFRDIVKDSFPHIIVAPNAGVAAYSSWLPTIELIKKIDVPAIFSDYCEEAAHLAACCITNVTSHPLAFPIQINPFRQPMVVEDNALHIPCYSNCFLFGI